MAFNKKTWVDGTNGGTPITAAELNRIEGGISAAYLEPVEARVLAAEQTASIVFTDLATPGPSVTVTVGDSGKVLLTLTASISNPGAAIAYSIMAFEVSGATTRAANDTDSVYAVVMTDQEMMYSRTLLVSGLNPGVTTFTPKYRTTYDQAPASFQRRCITAVPF